MAYGRKTGGRTKGTPNKATLDRELKAKVALTEEVRKHPPRKSDLDVMIEIRDFWMGYAATEQRLANEQNRLPDLDIMHKALELAGAMAARRAPYLHQRLNSVTLREDLLDLSRLNDSELSELERLRQIATVDRGDQGRAGATLN